MRCNLCGGHADEEDRCYGCGAYICEYCDKTSGILGPHEFMDHSKTNLLSLLEQDAPLLQKQRSDEAWERAKKAPQNRVSRFSRRARVRK